MDARIHWQVHVYLWVQQLLQYTTPGNMHSMETSWFWHVCDAQATGSRPVATCRTAKNRLRVQLVDYILCYQDN